MKVRIRARETVEFNQTVEMSDEEFKRLNEIEDEHLQAEELDRFIDRTDVFDASDFEVFGFSKEEDVLKEEKRLKEALND